MDKTITVNMENLSEEERNQLITLVKKANSSKKREVWKPKLYEVYYVVDGDGNVAEMNWTGAAYGYDLLAIGNVYQTKEQAEFEVERLKVLAEMRKIAFENNDDLDWDDCDRAKWYVAYDTVKRSIMTDWVSYVKANDIYFSSRLICKMCIDLVGEERIKKYYLGVED